MGDHRAGPTGTTATSPSTPPLRGKRIARHAAEVSTSEPYVGRRVAGGSPVAATGGDLDDVSAHLFTPTTSPVLEPYIGRRIARMPQIITAPDPDPVVVVAPGPVPEVVAPEPVVVAPDPEPVVVAPDPEPVVVAPEPLLPEPVVLEPPARPKRPAGRRAASRRTRVPSLPLLAGVAVLAISAGGALQAMHPGLDGAADAGRISPASALSGSSAVGSASLLGGRGGVVSRDSDRQALSQAGGLQAAADAQAEQRDAALSAFAAQAQKQAARIKLHQWVLPVAPGAYHLTARFGDYSPLWSHFHTGLDFAAPTGTPIMAVAGGTITSVGYSGAYGNRTIERLPDGTELWYCHQNEFGTTVGATVRPGEVIGYVGSTGNVTGPHLHLEVHPGGGDPVDPYAALVAHGLYPGPPN